MGHRANYSGLVIAGIGFVLTRFTVALAVYEDPIRFYFAGVVPLVLGLVLAAFGVALVVADVDPRLVRSAARWCVIGTGAMLVLVVLTLLGSAGGIPTMEAVRSGTTLSTFLIGGSIGGTLTGLYAARSRRQNDALQQQANRLEVLNRMLRHEVLNAVNVIQGYTTLDDDSGRVSETIKKRSAAIAQTIEDVSYLTWSATTSDAPDVTTDLVAELRASVRTVRERHPDATISVDPLPDDLSVQASERLEQVITQLLENAVTHTAADTDVEVAVTTVHGSVRLSVRDHGPGLPEPQQRLLETGEITEFDDPRDGYGLNIVRLIVESFGGEIETDVTDDGTTVTVVLPRTEHRTTGIESSSTGLTGIRPSVPHLAVILGASVFAGVLYGLMSEQLGGSVAAIGVFYGINDPVVGWITHEFHSAVFAFVFAGLVSFAPARYRDHVPAYVVLGAAWGLAVWLVAAGFVAPIWLRLLGTPVPVPTFSGLLLVNHLVWGGSLGLLTALGYRYVTQQSHSTGDRSVDGSAEERPAADRRARRE
ncbi:ATP-binding protein [Haloglomus litoreum]|uniref:ATP-binding protein n=1 Tax=Haloglomus litoreum TaxID=3034026 RepID=UPI0023E8B41D|nr:ATP-binding protein [Haloglomus sp. DT116]